MSETSENVSTLPGKGFEFSYEAFENIPNFVQGLRKVYNCESFPSFKSTYRVKRICDITQRELKNYTELRKKIKDDDPEREKKLQELHAIKVPIKWEPLTKEELAAIPGISPADLIAIEFIASPSAFEN